MTHYTTAETDSLLKSTILNPMQARKQVMRGATEEEAIIAECVAKGNLDCVIPQLARNGRALQRIEAVVRSLKTTHSLILGDARAASALEEHPAPFPVEFAARLIRMFSFVGDTVLDPFMGTGTTNLACANWGRNSIGIELDPDYFELARKRVGDHGADLYLSSSMTTRVHEHVST